MTLAQVKAFLIGVLKGWFTNKKVLDKISESDTGVLTYDGKTIDSGSVTDDDITTAITETVSELNKQ